MNRKQRILFVDDEPRVVSGLRRMMRSARAEWETFGAPGGREALDILGDNDIDVIVSDVRMPGMMGFELLDEVRKRHPATIRLALSGQASTRDLDRCVGPVHRFLSKPCAAGTLKDVLSWARVLMDMPVSDRLKGIIGRLEALPSLPAAYDRLQEELQAQKPTAKAVAAAVSRDVGMSLRVLQLASSSFYAAHSAMASPAHLVDFLGVDLLRRLAALPLAFRRCPRPEGENFSLARQCRHALTVASFARRIAETEGAEQNAAEEAYVAGLLHDVGKILFIAEFPDKYDEALALVKQGAMDPLDAEQRVLQVTHPAAGVYLLRLWGLPAGVARGAAAHHPRPIGADAAAQDSIPGVWVHAADVLAHEFCEPAEGLGQPELDAAYLSQAGCARRAYAWREACRQVVEQETDHGRENLVCR